MNTKAAISADIIASTSLEMNELRTVKISLESFFNDTKERVTSEFWGRIIKGDSVECIVPHIKDALRIALMLKCAIKSLPLSFTTSSSHYKKIDLRKKYFLNYGVRIAIGLGEMRIVDQELDIMDGEAMYLAGRKIQEGGDSKSKRITIKQTLFIEGCEEFTDVLRPYQVIVRFLDDIMNRLTAKQAKVVYCKLAGMSVEEMQNYLHLAQPTINTHLSRASWSAILEGLDYYESTLADQLS